MIKTITVQDNGTIQLTYDEFEELLKLFTNKDTNNVLIVKPKTYDLNEIKRLQDKVEKLERELQLAKDIPWYLNSPTVTNIFDKQLTYSDHTTPISTAEVYDDWGCNEVEK